MLCVIHMVIEESTANMGVSEQKDGLFVFLLAVDLVCQCVNDQM